MQEMEPALPIATTHPEPVDLDWTEEDWDGKKGKREGKSRRRKK